MAAERPEERPDRQLETAHSSTGCHRFIHLKLCGRFIGKNDCRKHRVRDRSKAEGDMTSAKSHSDHVGTLPQLFRRNFNDVGYDEAMRRAREIVPTLRERAQRAEDARMLIRENEQLLHETGLFRIHQPKSFGGMELDFVAIVDIPRRLGAAVPRRPGT
jgi:hypothetical protein